MIANLQIRFHLDAMHIIYRYDTKLSEVRVSGDFHLVEEFAHRVNRRYSPHFSGRA